VRRVTLHHVCCFRSSTTEHYLPFSHASLILFYIYETVEDPTKTVIRFSLPRPKIGADMWISILANSDRVQETEMNHYFILLTKLFLIVRSANRYVALLLLHFQRTRSVPLRSILFNSRKVIEHLTLIIETNNKIGLVTHTVPL